MNEKGAPPRMRRGAHIPRCNGFGKSLPKPKHPESSRYFPKLGWSSEGAAPSSILV